MASISDAKEHAGHWKTLILNHLREHPARSLAEATASVTEELTRVLQIEIEAGKPRPR